MRDDIDAEAVLRHLIDRQADAVECDRALGGDKARQLLGGVEDKAHRLGLGAPLDDPHQAVDMTQNEMPAELVAQSQRTLEIDRRALLPLRERGACQGLD